MRGIRSTRDFVTFAAGSPVEPEVLKSAGGFDSNYEAMAKYWNGRMAGLAEPISLPVVGMVEMYKSIQITTWENMVKNGEDYEIHAAPRNPFNNDNYDQPFSHDAPNYVDQYMREGDFNIAKRMLASKYFKASNSTSWKGREAMDPIYEDTLGNISFRTPSICVLLETSPTSPLGSGKNSRRPCAISMR